MKGLTERRVLYGHVFRNAMLIVIAGFPGAFVTPFFTGSLLIETIFSLDGLGLSLLREHRQPRLSGRLRQPLHLRAARTCGESHLRPHLYLDRSAHRFRNARGLTVSSSRRRRNASRAAASRAQAGCGCRRSTGAGSTISGEPARLLVVLDLHDAVRHVARLAEFLANDRPIVASYKGELLFPVFVDLSGREIRRLSGRDRLSRSRDRRTRSRRMAG